MVERAAEEGFMNPSNKELIVSAETADKLIHEIQNYERPVLGTEVEAVIIIQFYREFWKHMSLYLQKACVFNLVKYVNVEM